MGMKTTVGLAGIVILALITGSAEARTVTDFRDDDLTIKHEYSEIKRQPAKLVVKQDCKKNKGKDVCAAAALGGYTYTKPDDAAYCNCVRSNLYPYEQLKDERDKLCYFRCKKMYFDLNCKDKNFSIRYWRECK
jgi:hypothetical protein